MVEASELDPSLKEAMDASLRAYSSGDPAFFGFLTDDVRVFSLNSSEPTKSAKQFEEAFGGAFRRKREVEVINLDVDARGDRAVLSQTLEVTSEHVTSFIRQTVIWDRQDKGWRMSHIHNAQVGQPVFTGTAPRDAASIRVLNERIATVAATVGVAQ